MQVSFAALGGALGSVLGGWDGFLYALVVFVVIDYITGVMCAISDKTLSSEVGFRGICRKVLIFFLVGVANILDEMLYQGTMSIAKNLLKQGTISEEEYRQIDTMFKQKYEVSLFTLFTDIRLIKFADHGNM